ncbi:hypothetical protein V1517DRAFT_310258 [Lipomyces orientalis]|uniref:Uncharacterized protein n=1 Tax=Lipomyces orientalis TaxID=1233043 RepID=A0ACC3TFM1_9ASCO
MKPDTSEGQWIGYEILIGAGRGFGSCRRLVSRIEFCDVCAVFWRGHFASVANTVFTSSIGPSLLKYAPGINPNLLIHTGVTNLRQVIPAGELPHVFDVQLAASCAALLTGCFVGWRKVNDKKNTKKDVEDNDAIPDGTQTAAQTTDEEKAEQ